MTRRNFVTFKGAFPDEAQWTEDGSPLVPDGRSIGVVLTVALERVGFRPSQVVQHSFYGWAFEVGLPKAKAWCLLQGGEPWLLLIEERRHGLARLFGIAASHGTDPVLRAIDDALKHDGRFSSIRWFTKQEYESGAQGGADSPL